MAVDASRVQVRIVPPEVCNSVQPPNQGNTLCCGVQELWGLSNMTPTGAAKPYMTAEECLESLIRSQMLNRGCNRKNSFYCAHVVYNQATNSARPFEYGVAFTKFIEENKLGEVIKSAPAVNPNTSNFIVTFIWTIDRDAVDKWAEGRGIPELLETKKNATSSAATPR